jgi:hypothetical protein
MRERHIIDDNMAVITFETLNRAGDRRRAEEREPTERFSYYVEYKDTADKPRESETLAGFFSHEHCIHDALASIDMLDLTPEPEPEPAPTEPRITVPYHTHLCYDGGCGVHRCVNPACYSDKYGFPRKVAEIICPVCGKQTGVYSFEERMRYATVEFMPLVIEQPDAA